MQGLVAMGKAGAKGVIEKDLLEDMGPEKVKFKRYFWNINEQKLMTGLGCGASDGGRMSR